MKLAKELLSYVIIVVLVILLRTFIITPVKVDGPSMNPTLIDSEVLILNKTTSNFKRMDIVVFKYKNEKLIKRVIGLPGESISIKDNTIYINGNPIDDYSNTISTSSFELEELGFDKIPEGYYFVMGDNRYNSVDSRIIGLIKKEDIVGNIIFRVFPFSRFGTIKTN